MRQLVPSTVERRKDPRQPRAFAFWIRSVHAPQRVSAWMLDVSAGGAAFLTATEDAPPVGQRLEFSEMQTTDRLVREDAQILPTHARVLRHDDCEGVTRRVAVRFEIDADAGLFAAEHRIATTACSRLAVAMPPPPFEIDQKGKPAIPTEEPHI